MAHNKKEKLLEALKETQGLIYHACKKAGNISEAHTIAICEKMKNLLKQ